MMNENAKLQLTDITSYDDVEEGTLRLTLGDRQKSWKAIWLRNLRYYSNGNNSLPREALPLRFRNHRQWIDCPRLTLRRQKFMWIEPLQVSSWYDMGTNLYLCADAGWPHPLDLDDYERMVSVLVECGIDRLEVDQSLLECSHNRIQREGLAGLDDFFDSNN